MKCGISVYEYYPSVMMTRDGTEFLYYKCIREENVILSIPLKNQDDNYTLTYTISRCIDGRAAGSNINHHRDVMILGDN